MTLLIVLIGTVLTIASVVLAIKPDYVFEQLRARADSTRFRMLAVAIRLVIGIVLIAGASGTRFPVAILVLGWASVLVALALGFTGRERFRMLLEWAFRLPVVYRRIAAAMGIALGLFLSYSAV